MSNERAMAKWALIHAYLKNSPMMKPKDLEEKLRGQISRSDMFTFLKVYEDKGLIIRPSGSIMLVKKPSRWNILETLKYFDERRDKRKRELLVEDAVLHEEMDMNSEGMTPEQKAKAIRKYRKLYGLS